MVNAKTVGGVLVALPILAFAFGGSALSFVNVAHAGYGQDKVAVCHKGKTLEVAAPAVSAHTGHGDTLGACAPANPSVSKNGK